MQLADVSNFLAVRLRADVEQAGLREATEVREDVNVVFPSIINLFFAGTATRNISFFLEGEFATRPEEEFGFERAMLIFDNLGGHQLANLKVGRFDPSAFFSFPTHRQQLNPVPAVAETVDFPPPIDRAPLLPLAFASKMFGLTRGPSREGTDGFAILPFEPFLFNAPARTGATLYGRPFGTSFLYQVGVSQDETAEDDPDTRWDPYVMLRYDVVGRYSDVQASAFYHYARCRSTHAQTGAAAGVRSAGGLAPLRARAPLALPIPRHLRNGHMGQDRRRRVRRRAGVPVPVGHQRFRRERGGGLAADPQLAAGSAV